MSSGSGPPGRDAWQPRAGANRTSSADTPSRRGPPGREVAAARSSERRVWYGYGQLSRGEKDRTGTLLHDTIRIYGEVSVIGLPALLYVWRYPMTGFYDVTAMAIVAWLTMTVVGTLVRGGWIHPPATEAPGWVTLGPSLLVLRVGYFNLALLSASFGGLAVSGHLGPAVGLLLAVAIGALSMLAFPRTADEWMARRR